jgi:SAM-dependent methyltransferase
MLDAFQKITRHLDLDRMRGLEIGPLYKPQIRRDQGNIRYLDHATSDELKDKYASDASAAPHIGDIVDVDYVWVPGKRLADVVGDDGPFDYVIASHVFEHLPNPVGWLQQIREILSSDGMLTLVIPDKRYCFDAKRSLTTPAQLIDAHLRDLEFPSFHQIFDHHSGFLGDVDVVDLWDVRLDVRQLQRQDVADPVRFAFERCQHLSRSGQYEDVHCSTFTPESFLDLLATLARLDLLRLEVVDFFDTERYDFQFFTTLRHVGSSTAEGQLRSIAAARDRLRHGDGAPAHTPGRGTVHVEVSPLEERIIATKRATMTGLRDWQAAAGRALHRAVRRGR